MNQRLLILGTVIAAPLLMTQLARADLLITANINGGGNVTVCSAANPNPSCNGTLSSGGITLTTENANSNNPGTPSLADLLSSVGSITNNSGSTATIVLTIGDINFTLPTTPPTLDLHSQVGDTAVVGGAGDTFTYVSTVDQGNGQNTSPGTYNAPLVSLDLGSPSDNEFSNLLIANLSAPFSMTEVLRITIAAGDVINYSSSTNLSPVPEPASLLLFGSGLLGLGWFGRRRRNRNAV
ncbi:MAG: PEP-CTERM sorting domain-containing protein [Deltaproteobacteria bacterium]|nr:PEP-CTERM sorting domain-containing protein [Deltaproteobacteria bacterium]